MRDCQIEAITGLEKSFAENRPRGLIHMATGAGKTYTACAFSYRLIKYANARRILFLVDRSNLGKQARDEFHAYRTPDTGRLFTELYNVQHLTSPAIDDVCRVTICTIQRLYSILRGEELAEGADDISGAELAAALGSTRTRDVAYNPVVPIEKFDFIVTDECHRSIYNLWRQVLEYFDAFLVGLTATPAPQTIAYFHQNRVAEYNHERAVADGVNVGYDVYRIKTRVTEQGGKVEKGFLVDHRSKASRAARQAVLDEDLDYTPTDLDRSVVVPDQIRTVLSAYRDVVLHRAVPRPHARAEDAHLRQGRLARRGHRPHLSRGVREGQRLLQEDHLSGEARRHRQTGEVQGVDQGILSLAVATHRGDGRHDRDRDGHQAARSVDLPA